MNNPHHDILHAEMPEDPQKKEGYLNELKNRAKGAFQTKDLINAEKLYGRAIDCTDQDYLLYSNRCAVRLLMQRNEEALRDAKRCLNLEPTFIKAHYRKSQALQRLQKYEDAIAAAKEGLKHHDGNPELQKLVKDIETDWEADKEKKAKFNAEAQDLKKARPVPQPTRLPVDAPVKDAAKAGNGGKKEDKPSGGDGEEVNEMRGYKKTADGKTTSYFHTDISDEAKKLLAEAGMGKPQKLDAAAADADAKASAGVTGSAWNAAGTFEERNYTKYFHGELRSAFPSDTVVSLPNDLPDVFLNLDTITGDASITSARGKVKYIHDSTLDIKWEFTTADGKTAKGTIKFEEDGDCDYDVNVEVDNTTHSSTRSIVTEFVKSGGKGVQPFILEKIRGVEKAFKAIKP